jgi:hypothetical protein
MKKNTLIKHKEIVVICDESGHANLSYNALLTWYMGYIHYIIFYTI